MYADITACRIDNGGNIAGGASVGNNLTKFCHFLCWDKMGNWLILSLYGRFSPLFGMFYQKSCHTITICCTPAKKGLILHQNFRNALCSGTQAPPPAKRMKMIKTKYTMKKNDLLFNLLLVFLFPVFAVYSMWQEMRE